MQRKRNILFLKKKINLILFSSLLILFSITLLASLSQTVNPFLKNSKQTGNNNVQDNKTVLIVFDASRSMEEKINGETKVHIAKRVLEDVLLKATSNINIGLRVYGSGKPTNNISQDCGDSRLVIVPGVNNRRAIVSEIFKILPQGFTPITYSLSQAVQDLTPYTGERSIILISDGLETCGGDPCQLSKELANLNIDLKIDVVGFGVRDDWEAQQQLMCISLNTNGRYFSADSAEELTKGLSESINKSVTGRIITMIDKQAEEGTEDYKSLPMIEPEKLILKKKS